MIDKKTKWPDILWIVRHGESAGNVARRIAYESGSHRIELGDVNRDMDVPLSELGYRQSVAVGGLFKTLPTEQQPTVVLCSPYRRAYDTANTLLETANIYQNVQFVVDERLREKEFGVLDRLTTLGISQIYPEQAQMREALGKFYHRPPGGESWCDVLLRLRSVLDTINLEYSQERVLIVCHSVVVLCFRYLLEQLNESQILDIDSRTEVANCSVTSYNFDKTVGKLMLDVYNYVAPLQETGTKITSQPDAPIGPK